MEAGADMAKPMGFDTIPEIKRAMREIPGPHMATLSQAAGPKARSLSELEAAGGYPIVASQTPWQEIQRSVVGQAETGAVLEPAVKYQKLAQKIGVPRHNH